MKRSNNERLRPPCLHDGSNRGWKLLMIADQHQLSAPLDDRHQGAGLGGLCRLVHQNDGEFPARKEAMATTNGGRTDDLCIIKHTGGHLVFKSTNVLLCLIDVAVHEAFFTTFLARAEICEIASPHLGETPILLAWDGVPKQHPASQTEGFHVP